MKHKFYMAKSKFVGFLAMTLAEVLIVLGIVGIIAELTIPPVIMSFEAMVYEAGVKKAYSTLTNAFNQIISENSGSLTNITFIWTGRGQQALKDAFCEKAQCMSSCYSDNSSNFSTCMGYSKFTYFDKRKASSYGIWGQTWTAKTKDGMTYSFFSGAVGPNFSVSCSMTPFGIDSHCARVQVDINGMKGPNRMAYDIYMFYIKADKVLPAKDYSAPNDPCAIVGWTYASGEACTYHRLIGDTIKSN